MPKKALDFQRDVVTQKLNQEL